VSPSTQTEELTEYLMSPDEVRQYLGLSRTYTYRLLATGAIPSVRIGRLRKVRRTDLEQFIEAHLEHEGRADDE
jgi:excisionase family DNA binding protein